jgi:TRAP-type C4-dicarboxylate transport system permease small subunit
MRTSVNGALITLFSFMVLSVVAGVIGRYLNIKISHAVETATFAQIWMTAIGASVALRLGAMFALDTLTRHVNKSVGRILSVVIACLNLILVAVMFYGGILLTEQGLRQISPVLQIPMWTIFVCIPFGMALLSIEIVLQVIERWDDPFGADQEEVA